MFSGKDNTMATIKDVANLAKVSSATVSYVINNSQKVKEETREKVLKAIKELDYKPSFAGRMLKMKETKIIGAYVSDLRGYFYGEVLSGLKDCIVSRGYEFVIVTGSTTHRLINENIFDGAIILDSYFNSKELVNYADLGLKIVLMDRSMEHKNISCITLDNDKGIRLGMDYLINLGYREITCLTGPGDSYDSMARVRAALNYANRNNISLGMTEGNFNETGGYDFADRNYSNFSHKQAVFSFNDEMVKGIYNYFKDNEKNINDYLDISSFDNINIMQYLGVKLATVDYSKYDWGYQAGELLLNQLNEITVENQTFDVGLVCY